MARLILADLGRAVAVRAQPLRRRLATMQSDIVDLQDALGLSPVRSMPSSTEAELKEKVEYLKRHFDAAQVHGWFDAVSPRITDILTFEEVEDLLMALGFEDVEKTLLRARYWSRASSS